MQASQSNKASDLQQPDTQPDLTFTQSLPSPFSLPIHAARKYLERQRGNAGQIGQSGAEEAEPARHGALPRTEALPAWEWVSPGQGRQLERGLYQGHSIEAGLNFGPSPDGDAQAEDEPAYIAESDGPGPPFLCATQAPMPDPDAVRGAISRLARESGLRREAVRRPDERPDEKPAWDPLAAKASVVKALDVGAARPLNFGDVALRVWGADTASSGASHEEPGFELAAKAKGAATTAQGETGAAYGGEVKTAALPASQGDAGSVVERGPALAHDACNLLSGLALYSELLASPGVLGERHRHYAEELKLIAVRSQALIDRLLRVAAARAEQAMPSAGQTGAMAARDGVAGGVGPSQTELGNETVTTPQAVEVLPLCDVAPREGIHGMEEVVLHPHLVERAPSTIDPLACNGRAEGTSLVDLLMRWGSLLSTLAHGNLEVVFGPYASTPVPVEAEALERILVNLVRNARTATMQGGAVRIGVGLTGSGTPRTIALTVDDSGCGMTEAQVRRALGEDTDSEGPQPPVGPAGERGPRQGLGLRIVRELVAASGGTLSVQSWLGRGTRMEVRWLLAITEEAAAAKQEQHCLEDKAQLAAEVPGTAPPIGASILSATAPIEESTKTADPDGFSEAELRAMMLRLHRGGPPERSPLSRRLSERRGALPETGRRFGVVSSGAEGASRGRPWQTETGPEGAIAC